MNSSSSQDPSSQAAPSAEALARTLFGESPSNEAQAVQDWIHATPGRSREVGELERALSVSSVRPEVDLDALVGRLEQNLRAQSHAEPNAKPKGTPVWRRVAIGSAVAAACVAAVVFVVGVGNRDSQTWVQTEDGVTYVTAASERAELQLPDGSHVVLAPATTLRYIGKRSTGPRRIELDGQAYFAVTHHASRSFVVHSGTAVTQVLGTSFTVRSYTADGTLQVAVAEGKVAVRDANDDVVLQAGDIVRWAEGSQPAMSHGASIADVFGWTRGEFILKDVTLAEAVGEVQRQYGVAIEIQDSSISQKIVTLAFSGQSVHDMLLALELIANVKCEQQDGRYIIYSESRSGDHHG